MGVSMEVTLEEQQIILERRAKENHALATMAFQLKALKVASEWAHWSSIHGLALSATTFQSKHDFNYSDDDATLMFAAVKVIMAAVYFLEPPKEETQ